MLGVWKGVTHAIFFTPRGDAKVTFFSRFWYHFPSRGTPGASRAPLGAQVVSQVDFLMFFSPPGGGFGAPFGRFGLPRASRGATLGVTLAPKMDIKE